MITNSTSLKKMFVFLILFKAHQGMKSCASGYESDHDKIRNHNTRWEPASKEQVNNVV